MLDTPVNLYLVGFMGTGKTTIGRAAAERLGYTFLDTDAEIERVQDMTVAEIFEKKGEAEFRRLERAYIESGHPATGCVVACGGGLVVQPGIREVLAGKGVLICLHASLPTILERTQGLRHRPLLNVTEDPAERIRKLYAEREAIYRRAGTMMLTEGRSLNDMVSHMVRIYRREAADFLRRETVKS